MKLLFCTACEDLFRLTLQDRKCSCGRIGGKYINDSEAEIFGKEAISVAVGNGSFWSAIRGLQNLGCKTREEWHRAVLCRFCHKPTTNLNSALCDPCWDIKMQIMNLSFWQLLRYWWLA